ncbi:hypothetical protein HID58_005140 [Brassica napus]|uniref:Uncharacterized protein n=1 Tax=Brassica napus TaxID=3708 RepID=A0ABQ8E7P8_BRANA|nr:hypothetical protein HID58_005140 [Brassica napus]
MGQAQVIPDRHTAQTGLFALDAPQGDATAAGAPNLQSLRTYTHVHRRTVFTSEGSSDNRERLRLWTTRNAGQSSREPHKLLLDTSSPSPESLN